MEKLGLFFIVIILLCFDFAVPDDISTLRFVHILFRHGARSPLLVYPTDPNTESVWIEGLGKLTILGRQQQYGLGKYFHSRYEKFAEFSPLEVDVYSAPDDRCLKSAATNQASFFRPNQCWQFEPDLPWQPITIHYKAFDEDELLSESICPRVNEERKKVEKSPNTVAYNDQHKEMFRNLTYYSGNLIDDWNTTWYLYDTFFIERLHNLKTPSWIDPWWEEVESVACKYFNFYFGTQELLKLRGGPLLGDMVDIIKKKINGDLPDQKFKVYSGHDSNVAVLLMALGVYNDIAPPFASSVLLELHTLPDGVDSVRLLYLNSSYPEVWVDPPHLLTLKGCGEFCPLQRFMDIVRPIIPRDLGRECMESDGRI